MDYVDSKSIILKVSKCQNDTMKCTLEEMAILKLLAESDAIKQNKNYIIRVNSKRYGKWEELMGMGKAVNKFRANTNRLFNKIDGYNANEIEEMVRTEIEAKIEEYALDMSINDVVLTGSRCRGLENESSDLDIVVSYTGRVKEDTVFNIFHEDIMKIGGVVVDINPINTEKSGEVSEYLVSVEEYLSKQVSE